MQAVLEALLLPPGGLLLAALSFAVLALWRRCWALLIAGWLMVWALASPVVASSLADRLERQYPPLMLDADWLAREVGSSRDDHGAVASPPVIAVLGAGRDRARQEYAGADRPSALALERLAYAVHLHRLTGWPLALSGGGDPLRGGDAEAALLDRVLVEEYRLRATWIEGESRNTRENARRLADRLPRDGDGALPVVVVVTHAMHMPRAMAEFAEAGFADAVAAPMGFRGAGARGGPFTDGPHRGPGAAADPERSGVAAIVTTVLAGIPTAQSVETLRFALREWAATWRNRVRAALV